MRAKFIDWWWKYRKHIAIVAIIGFVVYLISVGYQIDATGFNGYHTVTTATAHSGKSPAIVTRTEVEVPAKPFWDWLQLLGIPLVLAFGALWFNRATSRNEQEIA